MNKANKGRLSRFSKNITLVFIGSIAALLVTGCGSTEGRSPDLAPKAKSGLPFVGFTRSLVTKEKRFAGFSKRAMRLSIIDPVGENEVESYLTDSKFEIALPLPGFDGVSLLSESKIEIVSGGVGVSYDIGNWIYRDSAVEIAAHVFTLPDNRIYILKSLGANLWQAQFFLDPFSTENSRSNGKNSPFFSDDASQLVVFRHEDASYAIYSSNSQRELTSEAVVCQQKTTVFEANGKSIEQSIYDSKNSVIYAATSDGSIYAADIGDGSTCFEFSSWESIELDSPVLDLSLSENKTILLTNKNSEFIELSFEGGKFNVAEKHEGLCELLTQPTYIGTAFFAMLCPKSANSSRGTILPGRYYNQLSNIVVIDRKTLDIKVNLQLDFDNLSGLAIDPDSNRLYYLEDSALGILNVVEFSETKATIERRIEGLFLEGILD